MKPGAAAKPLPLALMNGGISKLQGVEAYLSACPHLEKLPLSPHSPRAVGMSFIPSLWQKPAAQALREWSKPSQAEEP